MRILFVSGTSMGGAAKSTHELAAALCDRGHHVVTLMAVDEARRLRALHDEVLDASVRLRPLAPAIHRVRRRIGAAPRPDGGRPYPALRAAKPANALRRVVAEHRPDVVIANSLERPEWRQIHDDLSALGIPKVLYLRERTAIGHLVRGGLPGDLLLSNATGHADEAAALGFSAEVVPSVVDTSRAVVESTREHVVYVNPVPLFGLDIALALAEDRPDVPFTFVRSWPLEPDAERELLAAVAVRPNVSIQEFSADPRDVYRRARVVLLPYRHPGRPRVVPEAQASAIPILGSTEDGLAEAIGPGGRTVPVDAGRRAWANGLAAMWDDPTAYALLVDATRTWAGRAEISTTAIVDRFEALLHERLGLR
jgi:glycosyltransferase involved in cell wall biosynthesis